MLQSTRPGMRRQRGSAMMETVMVLPLVFVILGLVFFFGQAFEREQQQRILARYDVARIAGSATPAGPYATLGLDQQPDALNTLFFDDRASFVTIDWEGYRSPASDQLAQWAYTASTPTGDLATSLFNHAPTGSKIKLLADITSSINLPERVDGPVLRRSVHPGTSWAFADGLRQTAEGAWQYHIPAQRHLRVEARIRDVFYPDFDRQLDGFSEPASRMVSLTRGLLYAYQPGYRGPDVRYGVTP